MWKLTMIGVSLLLVAPLRASSADLLVGSPGLYNIAPSASSGTGSGEEEDAAAAASSSCPDATAMASCDATASSASASGTATATIAFETNTTTTLLSSSSPRRSISCSSSNDSDDEKEDEDTATTKDSLSSSSASVTTTTTTATSMLWPTKKDPPPLSPTSSKTILFVAHFFVSTDVNHMLLMAHELCHVRGHSCHFIVMAPYVKRVVRAGFSPEHVVATPNVLAGAGLSTIQRAFSYSSRETGWLTYIYKYICAIAPLAARYYEPSMTIVEEWIDNHGRPDLMVASKASESAIDVAWHRDIPLSVLFTMPLGGMINAYEDLVAAPDANLWGGVADHAGLWMRCRKILARIAMLANPVTVRAGLQLARIRFRHGYHPFAIPGDYWRRSVVISPWSLGIDLARPLRPLTHLVGFMTTPQPELPADEIGLRTRFSREDQEHLLYLNRKTDGVVFCAFGSLAVLTQEWFDEIVRGMDLWARAQPGHNNSHAGGVIAVNDLSLKAGLDVSHVPGTIHVTGWINQKLFLAHPHTKAFITHGGLGSLGEAIQARVPMLVFPLFFDQPNNAHRLEEAGVALKLHFREETVTSGKVATRLRRLTSDPAFARNLDKQYQISARAGGVVRAADLLEDVLLWEGDVRHLIPVNERATFFQRTNFDLIALALVAAGLACRAVARWYAATRYRVRIVLDNNHHHDRDVMSAHPTAVSCRTTTPSSNSSSSSGEGRQS